MGKLFGTDGVRGIANTELTAELAYQLGRAGAYVITKEKNHAPQILVGMDTRKSGHMLEAALVAGICSTGADALCVGVIPTPGIALLVQKYGLDAGVVISASHNPVEYNGIKFFNNQGYKLRDELENEIETLLFDKELYNKLPFPTGGLIGRRLVLEQAERDYVDSLKASCPISLEGMHVALDCANGAASVTAPLAISELGGNIRVIHNTPDGVNINRSCGSTHMESLIEFVKSTQAYIGLAFDGDADRCLAVDELGNVVDGDQIMAICANYFKQKGLLKRETVVATVMSNLGFFHMARDCGIKTEQTKVGDRYVLECMLDNGYNLGGEQSGHIIFLDHNTSGDGTLTAIQLLMIMKETGKKLSELAAVMEVMPQVLVNAKVNNQKKFDYMKVPDIKAAVEALENKYAGNGRVLIRTSGTEPLIRVMIEGKNITQMQQEADRLAGIIENQLS